MTYEILSQVAADDKGVHAHTHTHTHTHTYTPARTRAHTHRQPTRCVIKLATCLHQSLINQSNTETSPLHVICFSWKLIHWNRTFWGLFVPLHVEADVLFMVLLGTWSLFVSHMCKMVFVDVHKFCCLKARVCTRMWMFCLWCATEMTSHSCAGRVCYK